MLHFKEFVLQLVLNASYSTGTRGSFPAGKVAGGGGGGGGKRKNPSPRRGPETPISIP